MASPAQIAGNQRNYRKSTGQRTPEGLARSSVNSLKYGNRSRKLVLLREESIAFEDRLRKWMAINDAQNDVEEFGADETFGSGDGRDNRLERADVIDPDGVEQHGDELSGIGEIGEDAPSEANFAETMSSVETQEPIQVTANTGDFSGLDNGAAEPQEHSTPEQGKAPASGSASSNHKPQTPDWSARACRGSLPATVSQREERQSRCEEERRAVERMVEEKLKAGNFSLREILTSAMALPLSGGGGP